MSETKELQRRIEAEKKELQARIAQLKADGTAKANDVAEKLESKLDELNNYLRDGWDNLSENVARKLNDWLEKTKAA